METPGRYLKNEREHQGLSLKSVSKFTRIREYHLKAIEEDRYDLLPSSVYIKGFLTLYAKYLGLDPKEVLFRYQNYIKEISPPKPIEVSRKESPIKKKLSPWLFYLFIGVLSLFIVLNLFITPQEFLNWFSPLFPDQQEKNFHQRKKERIEEKVKFKEIKDIKAKQVEEEKKVSIEEKKEVEVKKVEVKEMERPVALEKEVRKVEKKGMAQKEPLLFEVIGAEIGSEIGREGGRLVLKGKGSEFICDNQRLYFLTKIKALEEGKVMHVWIWEGKEFFKMELEVRPPTWTTYTYVTLRSPYTGDWRAEVRAGEKILSSLGFKVRESTGQSYSGEQ